MGACITPYMRKSEDGSVESALSFSFTWAPGMELTSSGFQLLVASVFM